MATASKPILYIDTNVVIEATRTSCWKALKQRFEVHTVKEVRDEAARGDPKATGYVKVDMLEFDADVIVHEVSQKDVLTAMAKAPNLAAIDKGERDLLAWVAAQSPNALLLTTGDKAAVKAACGLKLDGRLRSLEELAKQCGLSPKVNLWFTTKWLATVKTEFLLDAL